MMLERLRHTIREYTSTAREIIRLHMVPLASSQAQAFQKRRKAHELRRRTTHQRTPHERRGER